jgi:hypothetical protein
MFIELVLVAVMAVLYGFAWHNEPAKETGQKSRTDRRP